MTFPRFAELPLELQDHVWELCIPNPPPLAHFAQAQLEDSKRFKRSIDGPPLLYRQTSSLKRSWISTIDAGPYRDLDRYTALRTLLHTASRSRAVALRHPDALDPVESVLLPESDVPSPEEDNLSKPALRVNAATDLVILEGDWYMGILSQEICSMGLQCHEPLRYLAISNSKDEVRIGSWSLLNMYRQLRVLYILLEPDKLRGRQPWEYNQEMEDDLETFIAVYAEGRIRPGPFRCGRREYFEIPPQQIWSLGGLARLVDTLETNRLLRSPSDDCPRVDNTKAMAEGKPDEMDEMEPVRFRLMTWRDV